MVESALPGMQGCPHLHLVSASPYQIHQCVNPSQP